MARQQSVVLVMVALVMMGCIAVMCLAEGEVSAAEPVIVAQFAKDVSSRVRDRVLVLLATTGQQVKTVAADNAVSYSTLPARSIVFGFGNTTTTRTIVGSLYVTLLSSVGSEGFFVQSATAPGSPNVTIIGCDGNINANDPFLLSKTTNIGLHYGVYRALEVVGYAFFHPLAPMTPPVPLAIDPYFCKSSSSSCIVKITESPFWPIRGWHYHTEHPLEITEALNGMDSGTTTWESMLPEVELFYEWLVANRQNRVEFLLLWAEDWNDFAWSPLRQGRLKQIVELGHQFGIASGSDVPLAEKQQHAWYMVKSRDSPEKQTQDIHTHVDWMFAAKFDFISTESGFSEFTHPNCTLMLQWMNIATDYVMNNYTNKRIYIKCHCSTGQYCPEFENPYNGNQPLNFNFLPAYASPQLGVYAHTVQFYNFTEPAPTYGNQNFTYMYEFMLAEMGKREVVYHGETAYWVNYDINVPLFLPIYALGRLDDLRLLAATQKRNPQARMDGQFNFCSGWEWGYWFNDVITARAAWNPETASTTRYAALASAFSEVTRIFGPAAANITSLLVKTVQAQEQLLVFGQVPGSPPPSSVVRRNGMAYIEGWDTWSELSSIVAPGTCTQPVKLGINEVRLKLGTEVNYEQEVEPLLNLMASTFASLSSEFTNILLQKTIPSTALPLYMDFVDGMNVTAQRTIQVHALYQYAWGYLKKSPSWRTANLNTAAAALVAAEEIVAEREQHYRVSVERIASYRENPTVYPFTYLWTAHSLYYFWRDYSKATNVSISTLTPCFMNINVPIDVVFGDGPLLNISLALEKWLDDHGLEVLGDCLNAPETEPHYPIVEVPNFPMSHQSSAHTPSSKRAKIRED